MADEFGVLDAFLGSVLISFVGVGDGLAGSPQVGNEILWQFIRDESGAQSGFGRFRGGSIRCLVFEELKERVGMYDEMMTRSVKLSGARKGAANPFSLSWIARAVRAMFWKSSVRASKSVSLLTRAGVCPAFALSRSMIKPSMFAK
jgi:hypothetical protein